MRDFAYCIGKVSIELPRSSSFFYVSIELPRPTLLMTLWMKINYGNGKVAIILQRFAVFVVLVYSVEKVSIKMPWSGSFLSIEKVP